MTPTAGSLECPFKLAIIGGGPSGSSVVIRAIRLGMLDELCDFEYVADDDSDAQVPISAGICIVDKSTKERFGGGHLQDYLINSNTYASKFVSNVLADKPEGLPPESVKETDLEKLQLSENAVSVASYGNKSAPLNEIGNFLRDCGGVVLESMRHYFESSKCFLETTVESLQYVNRTDGKFSGWKVKIVNNKTGIATDLYAKTVALSTGGRQEKPRFINAAHSAKVMTSDYVCTQAGIDELRERLRKSGEKWKVAIVGGSHSAFSAAWVCINKVCGVEGSSKASNQSRSGVANQPATGNGNTAGLTSPIGGAPNPPVSGSSATAATANSNNNTESHAKFGPSSICLLHRSPIDVFYSTKAEADQDGYTDIGMVNKQTGHIHPFGGIRGDAKELWRAIKSGRESRIRLLQIRGDIPVIHAKSTYKSCTPATLSHNNTLAGAPKPAIADKLFDEASVIIWACGYTTNMIPVYDIDGTLIPIQNYRSQVDVDEYAQILTADDYQFAAEKAMAKAAIVEGQTADLLNSGHSLPSNHHNSNSGSSGSGGNSGNGKSSNLSTMNGMSKALQSNIMDIFRSGVGGISTSPGAGRPIPGLLGSGLGFGLRASLDNGEADGSSGRADGVAVYLKRGATLILAKILGNKVYGGYKSWDERAAAMKRNAAMAAAAAAAANSSCPSGRPGSSSASFFTPPGSPKKHITPGSRGLCSPSTSSNPHTQFNSRASSSQRGTTVPITNSNSNSSQAVPSSCSKLNGGGSLILDAADVANSVARLSRPKQVITEPAQYSKSGTANGQLVYMEKKKKLPPSPITIGGGGGTAGGVPAKLEKYRLDLRESSNPATATSAAAGGGGGFSGQQSSGIVLSNTAGGSPNLTHRRQKSTGAAEEIKRMEKIRDDVNVLLSTAAAASTTTTGGVSATAAAAARASASVNVANMQETTPPTSRESGYDGARIPHPHQQQQQSSHALLQTQKSSSYIRLIDQYIAASDDNGTPPPPLFPATVGGGNDKLLVMAGGSNKHNMRSKSNPAAGAMRRHMDNSSNNNSSKTPLSLAATNKATKAPLPDIRRKSLELKETVDALLFDNTTRRETTSAREVLMTSKTTANGCTITGMVTAAKVPLQRHVVVTKNVQQLLSKSLNHSDKPS